MDKAFPKSIFEIISKSSQQKKWNLPTLTDWKRMNFMGSLE